MALSVYASSARQYASFDLDGIQFSNRNNLAVNGMITKGFWNTGGTNTSTDLTDSEKPAYRMWDERGNIASAITYSGDTPRFTYINFQFNTALGSTPMRFDHIAILGHNFVSGPLNAGNAGAEATIKVAWQVADDAAFTSNVFTGTELEANDIVPLQGYQDIRLVWNDLEVSPAVITNPPQRLKDVVYFRIRIDHGSGGAPTENWKPQIGELWLGERTALKQSPLVPYDADWELSKTETGDSYSGQMNRFVYARGISKRTLDWYFSGEDGPAELAEFQRWWAYTESGTKPFLYWENIKTGPILSCRLMMLDEPNFEVPLETYDYKRITLNMIEQPPFLSGEPPLELIP